MYQDDSNVTARRIQGADSSRRRGMINEQRTWPIHRRTPWGLKACSRSRGLKLGIYGRRTALLRLFSFLNTHSALDPDTQSMMAFYPRVFALLCTTLCLLATVLAINGDPQLDGIDKSMHTHAKAFYYPRDIASTSTSNAFGLYPHKNLEYFKQRSQNLAQSLPHILHEEAVHRSGVILVGRYKSWALGRKRTFYLSMIGPNTALGKQFGLNKPDAVSPQGKAAFAFWRHKGSEVKLLDVSTVAHTGAAYDLKHLGELIPLREVREVL